MSDQKEKIKALLDKAAKDLSQPMQDTLYEFGCRVVDYDEAEQLKVTNKQLLEALERIDLYASRIALSKDATLIRELVKEAITNAKQMGDKDE